MDAGCELNGYSSDITRTWPNSGRFSSAQKVVYEIVLDVQQRLLDMIEENLDSRPSLDGLYLSMQKMLGKHLVNEGIISKELNETEIIGKVSELCPHHVGHYLGMDVHDTALISRATALQKGMVITVEPGLYIAEDNGDVPYEFRGIGVRIEDDVLITDTGCNILSFACPKTVADIENLSRSN